jgi:sRNA-binding carbon storage regulator CsrA
MLSITRRDGEAIQIGSARLTWMSRRGNVAEVLLARKSGVSYMQMTANKKEILQIDGHRCVIVWNHHTQGGRERYRIHIDAPRFLPIHRTELLQSA